MNTQHSSYPPNQQYARMMSNSSREAATLTADHGCTTKIITDSFMRLLEESVRKAPRVKARLARSI